MHTAYFDLDVEPLPGVSLSVSVEVDLVGDYYPETSEEPASYPDIETIRICIEGHELVDILAPWVYDIVEEEVKSHYVDHLLEEDCIALGAPE